MIILNSYGQEMPHCDAKIVGNYQGLLILRGLIDKAIKENVANSPYDGDTCLFTSDGKGYRMVVECHNDEWGMNAPKDSFWNKEESCPEYTSMLF